MNIDWWQVLLAFIGSNGITFYLARPKRDALEIDNFKKLFDEAQEEMENMRKRYSSYEEKTDSKIKELAKELAAVKEQNDKMIRAINTAYRCDLATNIRDCPVLKNWDESCQRDEMGCKL